MEIVSLVDRLVTRGPLPAKARADAVHLALAAFHGVDYLLTWNCRHLNNAEIIPKASRLVRAVGYTMPYICTPEELMGAQP